MNRRNLWLDVGVAAAAGGILAAWYYVRLGLSLSHYDARAHLVVARRIFDSITPGWLQIGAVWLPLPHLLNALPVQVDFFYQTGLTAIAMSIASFAIATAAIAWIVEQITASRAAGVAGAAVFALNPNVVYLQSTPMTEPLLMATLLVSVAWLMAWTMPAARLTVIPDGREPNRNRISPRAVGLAFALASWTRYEAWPVTAVALACAAWARWRGGEHWPLALRGVVGIAFYPVLAIAAFFVLSRAVIGTWFAQDFFVPQNPAQGHPYVSLTLIIWGVRTLSGHALTVIAAAGLLAGVAIALVDRSRAFASIPLVLVGTAAVPWLAFFGGHPYRIRYMVPLIAAQAIGAGVAAGAWKRAQWVGALALALVIGFELRPIDAAVPMVAEAQWDRPNIIAREVVTSCLASNYDGTSVMVSMGSLGHYMQSLSLSGFAIRDFLHEGNGDIWLNALEDPRPFAGWMLIEEKAEGGDMLALRARERPDFLSGYSRVCEAAGVALYRRR